MSHAQDSSQPALTLRVGDRALRIEPDRIYVIGSGERADLRVRHASVDAYHAVFSLQQGRASIEDSGSRHGTFVDGRRIEGLTKLRPGAGLRVGEIPIEWHSPTSAGSLTPPNPLKRFEQSFGELMAEELRHAPWLMLSLVLHAAAALLLWLMLDQPDPGEPRAARISLIAEDGLGEEDYRPEAEDEPVVVEEPDREREALADPDLDFTAPEADDSSFEEFAPLGMANFEGAAMLQRIGGRGRGGADILDAVAGGGRSRQFRQTVTGLRRVGLEIMFVFDSTGSMGPVLDSTKLRITRLLEATQALVPDLRIGVVTYRDRGRAESYLTRAVPLGRDLFRAINFTQTVVHGGGGDHPEAVYDGLRVAVEQRWRPRAKRVIVLIGDAPAHGSDSRQIARMLQDFARGGSGQVHAIMTSPGLPDDIHPETERSFRAIAMAGGGICEPFEHEDQLLNQLLTLAIGKDFHREVDEVFAILGRGDRSIPAKIAAAVGQVDRAEIERGLRQQPVRPELVAALVQSRSQAIAKLLIRVLSAGGLPASARQAAAFALQRLLDLRSPPIDPESGTRIDDDESRRLWHLTEQSTLR